MANCVWVRGAWGPGGLWFPIVGTIVNFEITLFIQINTFDVIRILLKN